MATLWSSVPLQDPEVQDGGNATTSTWLTTYDGGGATPSSSYTLEAIAPKVTTWTPRSAP